MSFVETNRLFLRKVAPADYPYFREYLMDKEMDRMMLRTPCRTEEAVRQGFDWFLTREPRAYAIIYKESSQIIGNLTVYDNVPQNVAAQPCVRGKRGKSLSFAISPRWQRKGLMYEAVCAVIEHIFQEESIDYISCGYLSNNLPSKALQEKLGFHMLFSEKFLFNGQEIEAVENVLWKPDTAAPTRF